MNKSVLAAIVAVALWGTGCATQSVSSQSAQEVKDYCAQRMADARIDPVREKIQLPLAIGEPQGIDMLANRSFAGNESERKAVLALAEAHIACNKFAAQRLGPPPSFRVSSQDRITTALSDLYAGDITYGDFARMMLYIGARDQAASEDIEEAIKARERWADIDSTN